MKRKKPLVIALLPVFNEEGTVLDVLGRLRSRVDMIVCVNDGSSDGSLRVLRDFAKRSKGTYILDLPFNTGMAGALKQGFLFVLHLLKKRLVGEGDLVVTLDADGQHKPEYIPQAAAYLAKGGYDIVLTRRDFSVYPLYKVAGNRFLSWTNSILSGRRYFDVESGLRFLKVGTLPSILRYYTGVKYSCAQEIALISARAGWKIDNRFLVKIAYYRPGTTFWDGFIVLGLSLWTFLRILLGLESRAEDRGGLLERCFRDSRKIWKRK